VWFSYINSAELRSNDRAKPVRGAAGLTWTAVRALQPNRNVDANHLSREVNRYFRARCKPRRRGPAQARIGGGASTDKLRRVRRPGSDPFKRGKALRVESGEKPTAYVPLRARRLAVHAPACTGLDHANVRRQQA